MPDLPLVSFGLPVYNGERFIAQALATLLGQTYRNLEIVVSDNASKDDTGRIVREVAAVDPRVRYVRQPENVGMLPNFDLVAGLVRGEYFAWAGHDDFREPTWVEALLRAFRRHPGIGMAYCNHDWVNDEGRSVGVGKTQFFVGRGSRWRRAFSFSAEHGPFRNMCLEYLWRNGFLTYGLFRTDVVRAALPFENLFEYIAYADLLFLLKVLARERAEAVDEVLFHYRARARLAEDYCYQETNDRKARGKTAAEQDITPRDARSVQVLRARVAEIAREAGFGPVRAALFEKALPGIDALRGLREAARVPAAAARRMLGRAPAHDPQHEGY